MSRRSASVHSKKELHWTITVVATVKSIPKNLCQTFIKRGKVVEGTFLALYTDRGKVFTQIADLYDGSSQQNDIEYGERRNVLQAAVLNKRNRKWVSLSCVALAVAVLCSLLLWKGTAAGAQESPVPLHWTPHTHPGDGMTPIDYGPRICTAGDLGGCCNVTCKDESLSVLLECETDEKMSHLETMMENSNKHWNESEKVNSISTKLSEMYGIGTCEFNETALAEAKYQDRRGLKVSVQPAWDDLKEKYATGVPQDYSESNGVVDGDRYEETHH